MKNPRLSVFLIIIFAAVGTAAAPPLTFVFSDVIPQQASESYAYGINDAGVIVGAFVDSSGQHAMIVSGHKVLAVDHKYCLTESGFPNSIAFYGINNLGQAVGWCQSIRSRRDISFVYDKGKFTEIRFPGANGTEAYGINDQGDVSGSIDRFRQSGHGFVKIGAKYTSFDAPDYFGHTYGYGINNAGEIAAVGQNSNGKLRSFLYNGKRFKSLFDPKASGYGTAVHAVNNKGDAAGGYFDTTGAEVGFLYHGGQYFDLKDPKASPSTDVEGLNDKLTTVGFYFSSTYFGFKAVTK